MPHQRHWEYVADLRDRLINRMLAEWLKSKNWSVEDLARELDTDQWHADGLMKEIVEGVPFLLPKEHEAA